MGWWKISSVETGQIDWNHGNGELANAFPERDTKENNYMGDGPADIMSQALDNIVDEYNEAWGRDPTYEEIKACFNFVTGGMQNE